MYVTSVGRKDPESLKTLIIVPTPQKEETGKLFRKVWLLLKNNIFVVDKWEQERKYTFSKGNGHLNPSGGFICS